MVAWASGPRDEPLAANVVATTRRRTQGQVGIPYGSDGWEPSAETYRDPEPSGIWPGWDYLRPTQGLRLTQAVKRRTRRRLERVAVCAIIGEQVAFPHTVHRERLNGSLRDHLSCLTRKPHAFAKESETWDALFSLALFEPNWLRFHIALRIPLPEPRDARRYHQRTPAMALGLTDHQWSWQEFLLYRLGHDPRDRRWRSGWPTPFSHVRLFRRRPVIWLITSNPRGGPRRPPAFACFLAWERLDHDTLPKVWHVYLQPVLEGAQREVQQAEKRLATLRAQGGPGLTQADQEYQQAAARQQELADLADRLKRLLQSHRLEVQSRSRWVVEKVNEIVAQGYRPCRDYGVRVNLEPLKQAGILPVEAAWVKD